MGFMMFLIFILLFVFLFWISIRILHKAGFSGWWALLLLIPIVNIVFVWVFAFINWPKVPRKT